jgi:hypothetical protein
MDAFIEEVVRRLPLAQAVLHLFDFAFEPRFLDEIYEQHRGRCYTDELTFPALVGLMRDCLLVHGGSGRKGVVAAEQAGAMPVDQSSFYRKLANMPAAVAQALLRACTRRLAELVPPAQARSLPACVGGMDVLDTDGKKLKRAAKRLKACRGYGGKLLAAKVLVAMDARTGLAVAMSCSQDGEANDVPLVPDLLPQARQACGGGGRPILWVVDRQFGDLQTPRKLMGDGRDHYLARVSTGPTFEPDPDRPPATGVDAHGRAYTDQCGWLGARANKHRLYVRRIQMTLADGELLTLITDLTDAAAFPAIDLLELYRGRWGIEQLFQQEVTEVFELRRLIGCTPKAGLFQAAFCLLMYNLIQVVKAYAAADGGVEPAAVSTHNLFYDVKRELICWTHFDAPVLRSPTREPAAMRQHLAALLGGAWRAAWLKAADKKPRPKPAEKKRLNGGHTSVWRLLQAAAEAPA